MLSYKDKQLHIFDYDNTLYLDRSVDSEKREIYKKYVIDRIKELKKEGKLIAMASHNICASDYIYMKYNEIYRCFDMFICEYPRDKDVMVSKILEELNCKPEQAIFYDDLEKNVNLVKNLGVYCYLVDEFVGIEFEKIDFGTDAFSFCSSNECFVIDDDDNRR